ncbi:oxidoreductase [Stylonychia lemnae]|uniref:Oxidoreductase n=1 Tax=Stylonychia lemnae TaxID=5949 RepID=A0A078B6B6_STYLE|nr:oxidoreductase [Stylonychia lemnae]|eukprot:CDW89766.1 oxidoreductase [Stylonychia lemnae]
MLRSQEILLLDIWQNAHRMLSHSKSSYIKIITEEQNLTLSGSEKTYIIHFIHSTKNFFFPSLISHKEKQELVIKNRHPNATDFSKYFLDTETQEYLNEETCGFNENDLNSAIRVLRALSNPDQKFLIKHEKFGPFRKALRMIIGVGINKSDFIQKTLNEPSLVDQVSDLCCEMRIKKNNEKLHIKQQFEKQEYLQQQPNMIVNDQELESKSQQLAIQSETVESSATGMLKYQYNSQQNRNLEKQSYEIKYEKPSQEQIKSLYDIEQQPSQIDTNVLHQFAQSDEDQKLAKELIRKQVKISRRCYTCQKMYHTLHFFYDQLCVDCGDLNFYKRNQECDLRGKIALVTGGRIKIGYQIVLILLRNGAHTVVTTRFPKDAAIKLMKESDFNQWKDRLEIYGLDFKYVPSIYEFCEFFKSKYSRLDILINNAAQTIRREPALNEPYVKQEFEIDIESDNEMSGILPNDFRNQRLNHLLIQNGLMDKQTITINQDIKSCEVKNEVEELKCYEINTKTRMNTDSRSFQVSKSALVSKLKLDQNDDDQVEGPALYDVNNDLVDLRNKNSWVRELDEVSLSEFMEVYLINATAPFIICSQLKSLMERSPQRPRFIVNVSAMEGQFYKNFKNSTHPHTNMAKAALNMMTRTCGSYYSLSHIYMNAADTGWVTDENPRAFETHRTVPLDEIDGAMRVLDCVFVGFNYNELKHSRFFKDYKECFW